MYISNKLPVLFSLFIKADVKLSFLGLACPTWLTSWSNLAHLSAAQQACLGCPSQRFLQNIPGVWLQPTVSPLFSHEASFVHKNTLSYFFLSSEFSISPFSPISDSENFPCPELITSFWSVTVSQSAWPYSPAGYEEPRPSEKALYATYAQVT